MIKRLLTCLIFLAGVQFDGIAGPNASGALLLHANAALVYTDSQDSFGPGVAPCPAHQGDNPAVPGAPDGADDATRAFPLSLHAAEGNALVVLTQSDSLVYRNTTLPVTWSSGSSLSIDGLPCLPELTFSQYAQPDESVLIKRYSSVPFVQELVASGQT